MNLKAIVSNFGRVSVGSDVVPRATQNGHLAVDQGGLKYSELARAGKIFTAEASAGTAKAPVIAPPTTTIMWALYNGNPAGSNINLEIIEATAVLKSGTAGLGLSLLGTVSTANQTINPTRYAASVQTGSTGKLAGSSGAILANAVTMVGDQTAWRTLAARSQVSAVEIGTGLVANIDGSMIVPPGALFGLVVFAATGTSALFYPSITWAEVESQLA